MKKRLLLTFFCLSMAFLAVAGTIKGKISDARNRDPLVGATVYLEHTKFYTIVSLDGSYLLKNIPAGKYEIIASCVGYKKSREINVNIEEKNEVKEINMLLEPEVLGLDQVTVKGDNNGERDKAARSLEKRADIVQNILSAKTIQLLPDVTVANALQRISGVNIQRTSTGEGRYAIIRGMEQRYNNTLVNGIKIPSPDDKYRFVPMDMFPSELLERLEVIKSLTPNMEGDAIGGTMNLVMKNAPDKFLLSLNLAAGYSTLFSERPFSQFPHSGINKKSPAELHGNDYIASNKDFTVSNLKYGDKIPVNRSMGLTIGNRFLDKKLGVLFSVSCQDFYRASNSTYLIPGPQPQPDNQPLFMAVYQRLYSTQTNRIGINNKINYVFNNRNKISLYNLFLKQDEFQTRLTDNTSLGITSTSNEKLVDILHRSRWMQQTIYNSTLQGDHILNNSFRIDWSAVLSLAKSALPDMAEYTYANDVLLNGGIGGKDSITSTLQGMSRIWQHNSERDLAVYFNVSYYVKIAGHNVEVKTGLLSRSKKRENYYNNYLLNPALANGAPQKYTDIDAAQYIFLTSENGKGIITTTNSNSYSAIENINAAYLQAKFMFGKRLEIIGGARVEHTQLSYATVMPANFDARSGSIHYTDLLPGVHSLYKVNDRTNLRLSYFRSICRPGLYEVTPYLIPGEYFQEIGNPYLKHTRADNLDFRYEFFPRETADQVLIGAFYKYLRSPIEYFIARDGSPGSQFIKPDNIDHATNFGAELAVTKYLGKFGISANYTFTRSRIKTPKILSYYDSILGYAQRTVSQTRPLQGQADNVGNLSLLYKNPHIGLDMQLAFVFTGERIVQVSNYFHLDLWENPYSQLDLSLEKRICKGFLLYTKVNNLTNSAQKVYLKQPNKGFADPLPNQDKDNKILAQKDVYKLSILCGFRYKF
ncbi:TonB-dependent receptor [Flavitalea flava]